MLIERMNPWWSEKEWERNDFDLMKYVKEKIKWIPPWLKKISLKPFSLNFVLGPRQVGKTTGIKLLIKKLIEKGFDSSSILYLNCDLLASFKELRKIIEKQEGRKFIFLDEVTSIEYWWKVVKGFIDLGVFKNTVLTISGSSSVRVKKFMESFTGRRGSGKDVFVLPLSFKEFFNFLKFKKPEIDKAFESYMRVGGFPRSINQDLTFLQDLNSSIEKEFARVGKNYRIGREILYQLLRKAPSPLGFNTLGNEIGISHATVREYIGTMQDMFILGVAYHKAGKKINFRKEKKIFIRDPFLARTFSSITGIEIRKDFLYEWIVQEHLLRKYGEVFYWRNKYEIDAIANEQRIEVKAGKPHRKHPRNVKILDEGKIPRFLLKIDLG